MALVGLEVELCSTRRERFLDRWGCMLNSLYYRERKFPGRWGCMLSSLYYQERKIPRQVGLHAELFVLVNWTPVLKPI